MNSNPRQKSDAASPFRRFARSAGGNVAILFAFTLVTLSLGLGGGIDLARAYSARQKLVEVATLACQFASRPSIIQTDATDYSGQNGKSAYSTAVTNFISTSLTAQNFPYTQLTASPFTFTQNGPANVSLTANVPTTFMQLARISQVPVSAAIHCYDSPASVPAVVASAYIIEESFETGPPNCHGACYITASGVLGTPVTPSSAFPASPSYTGAFGAAWYVTGYCLETDHKGETKTTAADGNFSAELDCENGSNSAGNSSISTKAYLEAGDYELRYFYGSRVPYPDYDPAYICGTTASDLSWANDTNSEGGYPAGALRTNQINVYLDQATGAAPPLHTTIDGTQQLAGSNLIDMCVYGFNWMERSVKISVTTPAFYWLSFAADGANDSYGGDIDYIRFCQNTCPGTVQDNFPSAWLAANNGGVNVTLFEDTFESPVYVGNLSAFANKSGNMNNSQGTSGTVASGWPGLAASGWATAPYNVVTYDLAPFAGQGNQSVELDNFVSTPSNSAISRGFLLVPGYYQVSYDYISNAILTGVTSPACTAAPSAAAAATYAVSGTAAWYERFYPSTQSPPNYAKDTNTLGVFMAHGQLVSTPIGGGALGSQTSYNNPNGTVSTTPTASPYQVSLASYNPGQNNPLLDICGYASTWQARTTYIEITKPAYYWLTMAALGTADGIGGAIDDVKLTALGSLYMASPPANAVTIPVPAPQPGSTINFTGFSIVADPLTP
ncbi:MAG: TadE/TadG family type IV pilus assembly protein [Roseiarcus sp.]|jgi:Flp pilus assembly protein TadG